MEIKPLRPDLAKYLEKRRPTEIFSKQSKLFTKNPRHPSLHTEIIEPRSLKIYSFRLTKKFRAIFILVSPSEAEVIDVNNHYQ